MPFIDKLPYLLPFVANFFLITPSRTDAETLNYYKSHLLFLLLFGSLLFLIYWIKEKDQLYGKPLSTKKPLSHLKVNSLTYYPALLISVLILFSSLGVLRLNLSEQIFYFILAVFPLIAIQKRIFEGKFYRHLAISFVTDTYIGLAVFLMAIPPSIDFRKNLLMMLTICLSISCILAAHRITLHLIKITGPLLLEAQKLSQQQSSKISRKKKKKGKNKTTPKKSAEPTPPSTRTLRRTWACMVMIAPCLVAFLSFVHILPPFQMLTFLILYFCVQLIQDMKLKEDLVPIPDFFLRRITGIALLFAAMLLLSVMLEYLGV